MSATERPTLVDRIQTYFPNPVVGDLYYELVLTNYKDFGGGLMFPGTFHAHHDLDDDLDGSDDDEDDRPGRPFDEK